MEELTTGRYWIVFGAFIAITAINIYMFRRTRARRREMLEEQARKAREREEKSR